MDLLQLIAAMVYGVYLRDLFLVLTSEVLTIQMAVVHMQPSVGEHRLQDSKEACIRQVQPLQSLVISLIYNLRLIMILTLEPCSQSSKKRWLRAYLQADAFSARLT